MPRLSWRLRVDGQPLGGRQVALTDGVGLQFEETQRGIWKRLGLGQLIEKL